MSKFDKHNPFSFLAYGVSCRARAERVRYAGGTSGDSPPGALRLHWVPRSPAPWLPEIRLGFYVGAAAYTTRATNVTKVLSAELASLQPMADYTPHEVAEQLEQGYVQVIDVRQPEEHAAGRIAGDRLIELAQLPARADTIDPERPIVFYCRTGSRSAMATEAFRRAGFDAHNMLGGLIDWAAAGLPLDPPNGYVA
jgi:rhodanese-related sulfurtransferase